MTAILASVTVLCSSLFICAIIKMIAPTRNTEKILSLIISVFVLICIVLCFKSIRKEIRLNDFNIETSSEITDKAVLKLTGDYMAQYVKNLIECENITPNNVEVTVTTDENSVINLNKIIIYIDQSDAISESKIIDIIETDLSITPQIVRSDNEKVR